MGKLVNEAKQSVEMLIADKKNTMAQAAADQKLKDEAIDITMPAKFSSQGHLHPLSGFMNDMIDIFQCMGFDVVDGPEVETEHYNFECINVPEDHPARNMQDTFYLAKKYFHKISTTVKNSYSLNFVFF